MATNFELGNSKKGIDHTQVGNSAILRYPDNLSELYKNAEVNIIKFVPISYDSNKLVTFNNKSTIVAAGDKGNGAVYLELSDNLNIEDSHSWEAGQTFGSNRPYIDQLQDALERIGYGVVYNVVGKLVGLVGGEYLNESVLENAVTSNIGQTIINPNTTLIYNSSNLRTLNLDFVLKPESEAEAKDIVRIVDFFKFYSRGSITDNVSGGIKFPYLWYISTSSDILNNYLESGDAEEHSIFFACNSVNPSIKTNVMYYNTYPHEVDLSLSFTEMIPRYRQELKKT